MGVGTGQASPPGPEAAPVGSTPEEEIEAVHRVLRHEIELQLLERLLSGSPLFFEKAVLAVLTGMGFGGSLAHAAQHLGKPGDEGLDGVINEDALGLDKIYVQAKRYTNQVSQSKSEASPAVLMVPMPARE